LGAKNGGLRSLLSRDPPGVTAQKKTSCQSKPQNHIRPGSVNSFSWCAISIKSVSKKLNKIFFLSISIVAIIILAWISYQKY
jgi:hypothetical protein